MLSPENRGQRADVRTANQGAYTNSAKTTDYALGLGNSALREWVAFRLARDVETCERLLLGQPVSPDRCDQDELAFLRSLRLVRMDFRAIRMVEDSLRRHQLIELVKAAA
jgi:hypothetical protein